MNEYYLSNSNLLTCPDPTTLHKLQQNLVILIDRNPGIRYRELLRLTNSSNGVLSYHLAELMASKYIKADRQKGVSRYYPIQLSSAITKIISHIKNPVSRYILLLLIEKGPSTLGEIAALTNKAPSTISWYLQRLLKAGIVSRKPMGSDGIICKSKFYDVLDKTLVADVISKYVENPLEQMINNYTDIIDELG